MNEKLQKQPPRRRVVVFGSTGSIGQNTVKLLDQYRDHLQCTALVAHRNVELLASQAKLLQPELVALVDPLQVDRLRSLLSGQATRVITGPEINRLVLERAPDLVVLAIVGFAGLAPAWQALGRGIDVAIANKESLVAAGRSLRRLAKRQDARLIPIDSEHSGVFQLLGDAEKPKELRRITLTASGGPFLHAPRERLEHVTPEQAVQHPQWSMGPKNSVDSATMMNKGLEIIEASHLFDLPGTMIDALVHPQSIVHALVEYHDGTQLAQLSLPDMRIAIAYALGWPEQRFAGAGERLDLAATGRLEFEPVDRNRFPAIDLARQALAMGDHACCVLNAANEIAVEAFLAGKIGFCAITDWVAKALDDLAHDHGDRLDDAVGHNAWQAICSLDQEVRQAMNRKIAAL